MDEKMTKALEADGDKLQQLTGEDHGPRWMWNDSTIYAGERDVPDLPWRARLSPHEITALKYKIIDFIHDHDPFGDRFSQHDLRCLSQYLADAPPTRRYLKRYPSVPSPSGSPRGRVQ